MSLTELGFTASGNTGHRKLVLWEVRVWMRGRGRREASAPPGVGGPETLKSKLSVTLFGEISLPAIQASLLFKKERRKKRTFRNRTKF